MREYVNFRVAVLFGLAIIVGCQQQAPVPPPTPAPPAGNTHIMAVTPPYNEIDIELIAKPRDLLKWQAGSPTQKFWVHFQGGSPCGPAKQDLPSINGVAECTVVAPSGSSEPIYYQYYIDNQPKQSPNIGPHSCGGCQLQQGQSATLMPTAPSNSSSSAAVSSSGTSTPQSSSFMSNTSGSGAYIYCSATDNKLMVDGPTNPGSVIRWTANSTVGDNWSVTFPYPPQPKPLCSNGTVFSGTNNICNLSTSPVPASKFQVSGTNCTPNSQTFPIPASQ